MIAVLMLDTTCSYVLQGQQQLGRSKPRCRVDEVTDLDAATQVTRPLLIGSQHPSPNVKTFCNLEPQIWPENIRSRDAESTCFKGSRASCDVIIWGIFGQILAGKIHIT